MLDALGNRTSEQIRTTGGAVVWQLARTINGANRVVAETVGANQTTTYGHDANGQLTSEANALSQTTSYGLDGLQRMTAITDAANAVATLAYDARDAVTTATDFKGVATTYARNAFGEAAQETSPDIGSRATQFDAAGRPSQVTDALGQTTTITRDVIGRPTQLAFADGKTTVLRHDLAGADYNAPGAPNASKGRLSEVQDRSGTTRWQRDLLGRVTQKVQVLANGSAQTVGYTYNAKGLLDTLTYPGGEQLKHHYTTAGQLTAMDWNGVPLVTGIQWNAAGQPTGWTWAFSTPVQASRSHDTAGRMTVNEFASYTWDAAGRLTSIAQSLARPADADPVSSSIVWGTTTFTASYDAVGRITGFGNGVASTTFSYDANGNRTAGSYLVGEFSANRLYSIDATSNRMVGVTHTASGAGGTTTLSQSYVWDANGSMTSDGKNLYAYDAERRLSSSTTGTGADAAVTRYAHNALGQRVFKTEPLYTAPQEGASEQTLWEQFLGFFGLLWTPQTQPNEQLGWAFMYDEEGTLLSEIGMGGPSSTGATHHIWLPTPSGPMPIVVIVNGSKFAVHADHLKTPRRLTSESGQTVWQWAYSAFGDEEPTKAAHRFAHPSEGFTTSVPDVTYNLRYPGQYADRESGLHYNYFRNYDPLRGGYFQVDPTGLDGGWNRFVYASSNALSRIDPFGLTDIPNPNGVVPGGPWIPHDVNRPGQFLGPQPEGGGGRAQCQWVPAESQGGPRGSEGYWKVNEHGQKSWQRYDQRGNAITPQQAHPGYRSQGGPTNGRGGGGGGGAGSLRNPMSRFGNALN